MRSRSWAFTGCVSCLRPSAGWAGDGFVLGHARHVWFGEADPGDEQVHHLAEVGSAVGALGLPRAGVMPARTQFKKTSSVTSSWPRMVWLQMLGPREFVCHMAVLVGPRTIRVGSPPSISQSFR